MSSEIVKTEAPKYEDGGLIASAPPVSTGGNPLNIGWLRMWSGTSDEDLAFPAMVGVAKRGDYFDATEQRIIGKSVKILPLWFEQTWVKFVKGQKRPIYVKKTLAEVPPEDLTYDYDSPDPEKRKPKATETWTYIVLVEGEPFPFRVAFRKTSVAIGPKIYELEDRRGARDRAAKEKGLPTQGRGAYVLASEDRVNKENQSYKRMTCQPAGNVPDEMKGLLSATVSKIQEFVAAARKQEAEAEGEVDAPF